MQTTEGILSVIELVWMKISTSPYRKKKVESTGIQLHAF
jgi:hypothetical protein